ncbi:LysM peptidoglycan-binding domain-containing protein [Microbacterium protaetiae]|uniref:LysM peptidoglycan-binding domain-containing protein n=1 Tax=Microbacterium protaetiae TaxID=2509458 RepID=A0A4P6ES86_9MICO|nr:LysM peptidoglycan-binding domain-containing protein [Microbacterium protaetiae]QAY60818.1 LysM peptidoglycan-binding domain-containing protein [Microbacterium protaetiae]
MVTIAPTAPTATRLRVTRRGRRVLAALVALPVAAAIAAAAISSGSALASRDAGAPSGTFTTVTVSAGDSLWGIAQRIAPEADPRDVVDAIVRLNALDGVSITPGEQLSVPQEYAPAR